MRNTASKDKNVRLVRAYHTPTLDTLVYEGYGRELHVCHAKPGKGWVVMWPDALYEPMKKAHAIAKAAELLKQGLRS